MKNNQNFHKTLQTKLIKKKLYKAQKNIFTFPFINYKMNIKLSL